MPDTDSPSLLDIERLAMAADSEAEQQELIALFFRMAADSVKAMAGAEGADAALLWRHAAHSLRGAAANLGMGRLEALCTEAEKPGGDQDRAARLAAIEAELRKIRKYIMSHYPYMLLEG